MSTPLYVTKVRHLPPNSPIFRRRGSLGRPLWFANHITRKMYPLFKLAGRSPPLVEVCPFRLLFCSIHRLKKDNPEWLIVRGKRLRVFQSVRLYMGKARPCIPRSANVAIIIFDIATPNVVLKAKSLDRRRSCLRANSDPNSTQSYPPHSFSVRVRLIVGVPRKRRRAAIQGGDRRGKADSAISSCSGGPDWIAQLSSEVMMNGVIRYTRPLGRHCRLPL